MSKTTHHPGIWLGLGVLSLGGLALLGSSTGQRGGEDLTEGLDDALEAGEDWRQLIIRKVSQHEGRHDSLNLNLDNVGLSFGILQWVQAKGTLGVLLTAMYHTDPTRFQSIFGPHWQALLKVTRAGSLEAVGGALLWHEPWVSRFKAAGRDPVFMAVQDKMAAEGEHMKSAIHAASRLGIVTVRSVALTFDTAVAQGPGFALKLADRIRNRYAGRRVQVHELLSAYALEGPAHFRRTQAPTEPYPVAHISWRQVGPSEWHAFAGSFDLYTILLRNRRAILQDAQLSDRPIHIVA